MYIMIDISKYINKQMELFVYDLLKEVYIKELKYHKKYLSIIPDYQCDNFIFELKIDMRDLNNYSWQINFYKIICPKPLYVILFNRTKTSAIPCHKDLFYVDELIDLLEEENKEQFINRKEIIDNMYNNRRVM